MKCEKCDPYAGIFAGLKTWRVVPNETPSVVVDGSDRTREGVFDSVSRATEKAKGMADIYPGEEFRVFAQVGSEKREKKSKAEVVADAARKDIGKVQTLNASRCERAVYKGERLSVWADGDVVCTRTRVIELL